MAPGPARRRTWGTTMGRDVHAIGEGLAVTAGRELRERRTNRRRPSTPVPVEAVFCWYGLLTASRSPRWSHPTGGTLTSVLAQLDTAGSTLTVLNVAVNGAVVVTVTVSGWTEDILQVPVGPDDYVQVEVVTVGTGAESLTVQARFG